MKEKVYTFSCYGECPFNHMERYGINAGRHICIWDHREDGERSEHLNDFCEEYPFPEWCPLPDAKEAADGN